MGNTTKTTSQYVERHTNSQHYQNNIAPGKDQMFLRALCDALDVGVSILDENLDYQFISNSVFRHLEVKSDQLSIGDNLSQCHELMLAKGLLTPALIEENRLSAEEQHAHIRNNEQNVPTIVKLGNGATHKVIRRTLPNGYTVSMSHDISELVEKDRLLNEALALGRAGYWTYDVSSKSYDFSPTLQMVLPDNFMETIKDSGFLAIIHPEDRDIARKALKNVHNTNYHFRYKVRAITRTGKYVWGNTVGEIILDKDGKPAKIRAFVINIEKEKQQAEELERAKDEAIADFRHGRTASQF